MKTKCTYANIDSGFVNILFFIINRANSFHYIIQDVVEKVTHRKGCLLGTTESLCTITIPMEEDYFLVPFQGISVSFNIASSTVVFSRICIFTSIPRYSSSRKSGILILTQDQQYLFKLLMGLEHQLILHTLKSFQQC